MERKKIYHFFFLCSGGSFLSFLFLLYRLCASMYAKAPSEYIRSYVFLLCGGEQTRCSRFSRLWFSLSLCPVVVTSLLWSVIKKKKKNSFRFQKKNKKRNVILYNVYTVYVLARTRGFHNIISLLGYVFFSCTHYRDKNKKMHCVAS